MTPLRIGAVILARMDSSRLPGKVIATVAGRPLLWYVASRIPTTILDAPVILATSDRDLDTPLAETAAALGLAVFRGSAEDVAARILGAGAAWGLDGLYRVNGDSPFVEASLMVEAASLYRATRPDLVTNLLPRSFPYGVSVELFDRLSLASALQARGVPRLREHVTAAFYDAPDEFVIRNIANPDPDAQATDTGIRLTVDQPADLDAFRRFIASNHTAWAETRYRDALRSGRFGRN